MADTSSTPTFPIPASARLHPTTANPSAPGATTNTPGTTTSTPTTSIPTTTAPPATTAPGAAGGATATSSTPVPGATTGVPATTTPGQSSLTVHAVTRTPAKHSETLSPAAIAAVAVAAVLLLACLGWALARRRAFEPHWLLSLRHAMAEAGFRLSATWAEFTDWSRLGH
jgi:cobalamin biosynthesis Mg chelatase CobN